MLMMSLKISPYALWLTMVLVTIAVKADDVEPEAEIFARVGDSTILLKEYKQDLRRSARTTFYHRKPPAEELLAFQKKVADDLINRALLLQQVDRLRLELDEMLLEKELDKYRQRAGRRGEDIDEESEYWQALRERIRQDLLTAKLEREIRQSIAQPSEEELLAYYQAHPEMFTEPARFDLSTILLGVNASSLRESWDAARQEAEDIVKRLRAGGDFAELARLHSADVSAADGGELGYVHQGMFSAEAQQVIEELKPEEISEPLQVLEGMVIFRLNARQPERLMEFTKVHERVQDLWLRDEGDHYWQGYIADLHENTVIEIEERYLTISGEKDTSVN
jgi:parvulin-like peptidyl-prolyl isomerase